MYTGIERENALKADCAEFCYGNEQIMGVLKIYGEKEASTVGTIILYSTLDA